jgi:hypothetical protein
MVANYSLCFPIVAARHRLQAVPMLYSFRKDTPIYGARKILESYRRGNGIRALYPGFGLGLLGQSLSAVYESMIGQLMNMVLPEAKKVGRPLYYLAMLIGKGLTFASNIPLFPLYKNALILRIQSDTANTRIVIHNYRDFLRIYRQDLSQFWKLASFKWNITPAFLPSCITNFITEKILIYLYHHLYKAFTNSSLESSKKRKEKESMLNTFYPELACGVISSITARILSYPIDTVIFKLMVQDSGVLRVNTTYTGFFDCIIRTWRDEGGWRAFFSGWGIGILEIGMGYAMLEVSWLTYRFMQWRLQSGCPSDSNAIRKARRLRDRLQ